MLELIDTNPALDVQESEYHRLLGFPRNHRVDGRSRELAEWAGQWYAEHGRPWLYARQADAVVLAGGRLTIEGTTFVSGRLEGPMREAGAASAVLVAVSAGAQCETEARRLWEEGRPDEYFFLEVFGSAVVEALVAAASYRLCDWADSRGQAVLPHYSPGYPGWDVADQQRLLELTTRAGRGFPGDIRALDSGMLQPKKSLLAVFGVTSHVERVQPLASLVPCTCCSLRGCRYRRAPYQQPLPRIEGVGERRPALAPDARYSVSPGVLQKWSRERLRLSVLGDRTVDARFRYDGTTCSNMGHPLAFEYHVRLASREEGYVIIGAGCGPVGGDTGHTLMCEYLADAESLMSRIAGEAPLLGRPLDDVVTWERRHNPAGCYCTPESREHKWGLVLETLHFALADEEDP